MDLQIIFEPSIDNRSTSCLILRVGAAMARSCSMSANDHFYDLAAIRTLLADRKLTSIMLGAEPVAAIKYASGYGSALFSPYRRRGEKPIVGEFVIEQALGHIDQTLEYLSLYIDGDRSALELQVAEDISSGVYDV